MKRVFLIAFALVTCFCIHINAQTLNDVIVFQQNVRHTGMTKFAGNGNSSPKWSIWAGGQIWSSPVVGNDDIVYLGSREKLMVAIDSDGKKKWSVATKSEVLGSPAIDKNGTVYFGDLSRNIYAVNKDGQIGWTFRTKGAIHSSPALTKDGDTLFL